jgi:membrane glycosyltransferase
MGNRAVAGEAEDPVSSQVFTRRRVLFAALVAATIAALLWLMVVALSPGGFTFVDAVLLALFALTLPWTVVGFWNAMIGFLVMRLSRDAVAAVLPAAARIRDDEPVTASTAILVCIRNETPDRVIRNLEPLLAGLVDAGAAGWFHVYVLSDTSDAGTAAAEEARFSALSAVWRERIAITYRRRSDNRGFKAGNIGDFCQRWGAGHDLAVTLDADSIMTAAAVLRLVRVMQAAPRIGILQGLVIGLPSTSAFARLFQFGMRLGMRSYTIGSAWWQGDCGPYWGHNAVLRLAPFMAHCDLPVLSKGGALGGFVLSHDQIEAVLMRRAGYEVRVLPEEDLGWEENPPTLIEFIRRDLRWCQGNMQYWNFVALPGLRPVSRYQLAFAIMMFLGSPGWIGLYVLGSVAVALTPSPSAVLDPAAGLAVFVLVLVMWFAPKIATVLDVLARPEQRRAFGGSARFLASVTVETVFTLLLLPIMWFSHTVFLAALPLGRTVSWMGQMRDDHAVPVSQALRNLWPQTALGVLGIALLAMTHPVAIPYALFVAGGLALSVPFAVATSSPALGKALARLGIGRLPEETAPPAVLSTLGLPALDVAKAANPCPA